MITKQKHLNCLKELIKICPGVKYDFLPSSLLYKIFRDPFMRLDNEFNQNVKFYSDLKQLYHELIITSFAPYLQYYIAQTGNQVLAFYAEKQTTN